MFVNFYLECFFCCVKIKYNTVKHKHIRYLGTLAVAILLQKRDTVFLHGPFP